MTGELLRILLVEDDEDDYVLTQAFLSEIKEFKTDLIWASTYDEALQQLKSGTPDIILVDYHLGERNGLDFVREAQSQGYLTPILVLTGQGDRDVDLAAMKAGAVDYLEKDQITVPLLERALRYAVQRAQMLTELRELAVHDDLTGLYNRRELNRFMAEEYVRCRRYGRSMALLMLDLDRFKELNDQQGHLAGDEVLRQVAQALRETCRAVDRPTRYGGDEFAVLLPETPGDAALGMAERLCKVVPGMVEARLKTGGLVPGATVSLSIGVAELPGDADTPQTLLERADQALYAAKRRGGNGVVPAWVLRAL